jgi:hypothetical protein
LGRRSRDGIWRRETTDLRLDLLCAAAAHRHTSPILALLAPCPIRRTEISQYPVGVEAGGARSAPSPRRMLDAAAAAMPENERGLGRRWMRGDWVGEVGFRLQLFRAVHASAPPLKRAVETDVQTHRTVGPKHSQMRVENGQCMAFTSALLPRSWTVKIGRSTCFNLCECPMEHQLYL